jgi:maleate isomerase
MAQNLRGSLDAIVLSACVQMPSADQIERAEHLLGVPVISAATATAYQGLKAMGIQPAIRGFGKLLAPTA